MKCLVACAALTLALAGSSGVAAQTTPAAHALPPPDMNSRGVRGFLQSAETVAEGVTVLRQATHFYAVVGNVTVVEQSDGVVLIDSGSSYGVGSRVVDHVRRITHKPVKAVIITHWHNDHPLGLAAIVEVWPQAEVLASAETARDMRTRISPAIPRAPGGSWDGSRYLTIYPQTLEAIQEATAPEVRRGLEDAADLILRAAADQAGTWVVMPTRTVTDGTVLDDAERPITIRQLGRGNTDGDLVMWLPRQKIVVAGDVVVWPLPYHFNVYPREWAAVIGQIRDMPFDRLIPGHGEVLTDRVYLDRLIGLQAVTEAMVKAAVAEGLTEEQVIEQAAQRMAEQRRLFVGDDPWLMQWFDAYTAAPFAQSVYREVTGAPIGPPPAD